MWKVVFRGTSVIAKARYYWTITLEQKLQKLLTKRAHFEISRKNQKNMPHVVSMRNTKLDSNSENASVSRECNSQPILLHCHFLQFFSGNSSNMSIKGFEMYFDPELWADSSRGLCFFFLFVAHLVCWQQTFARQFRTYRRGAFQSAIKLHDFLYLATDY